MTPAFVPLAPATDAAFFVVFGLFVVALVVLAVIIIVWAVRNDIAGRRAWRARQEIAWRAREESDPVAAPEPRPRLRQQRPPGSER